MVASPLSHFTKVTLKNPHICIIQPSFCTHARNEVGCSNGSWDIDCQRGNLTRVISKITKLHTGQL